MNSGGNSSISPANSRAETTQTTNHGSVDTIHYEDDTSREKLNRQGFSCFDDFWNLPHEFVDDVNYRRGGWSAVSTLDLGNGDSKQLFYVKRQENQLRYSLRYPFGRLTFRYEIDAIKRCQRLDLPAVDVACWGEQKSAGNYRAIVVTPAITDGTLLDLMNSDPDWDAVLPLLRQCGATIYRMHQHRIRHGALYPNHIFLNQQTAEIKLIDLEGSRKCLSVEQAIKADMRQFLKRIGGMPIAAREALLAPYTANYNKLLQTALKNRDGQ